MSDLAIFDAIVVIEQAAKAGDDIWEMSIGAGLQAHEDMDAGRWRIGDLALLIGKQYGEHRIEDFAKSIKVEVGRVKEYRTVCHFWQKSVRTDILEACPNATYSHLRIAMRLKNLQAAMDFVDECSANDWTAEFARLELNKRLGKPVPPRRLLDGQAKLVSGELERLILELLSASFIVNEGLTKLEGKQVRIVMYEVPEDDDAAV